MTKQLNTKILFFSMALMLAFTVSACTPKAVTNTNTTSDDAMLKDKGSVVEDDDTTMKVPAIGNEGIDEMMENKDSVVEDDNSAMEDESMVTKTFDITGKNFEFSQKEIRVKQGEKVVVNFTSTGGFHDWVVDEFAAQTAQVESGQSSSVTFVADRAGTYEFYCGVGKHRSLGMVGKLIVE